MRHSGPLNKVKYELYSVFLPPLFRGMENLDYLFYILPADTLSIPKLTTVEGGDICD
jgi:hypothetical protein